MLTMLTKNCLAVSHIEKEIQLISVNKSFSPQKSAKIRALELCRVAIAAGIQLAFKEGFEPVISSGLWRWVSVGRQRGRVSIALPC